MGGGFKNDLLVSKCRQCTETGYFTKFSVRRSKRRKDRLKRILVKNRFITDEQ